MLNTHSWQQFKLNDLFVFYRGKGITTTEILENQGNIPCIQSGENNNGIIGYMDNSFITDNSHTYVQAPFISVARSGTSGVACFQNKNSYIGDSVYALKLHKNENHLIYLFLVTLLNKERYRYGYGRKVSIEKYIETFIKLPINKQGTPDWEYIINYIDSFGLKLPKTKNDSKNSLALNVQKWKEFNLSDIFTNVERGKRLTKEDREKGNIPLITAGAEQEGVAEYIANEEMKRYRNAITIDMFANCFYREYVFCCDDNILVLSNENINKYTGIFIATIINTDKYRFQYGRQYRQNNFRQHKIKLPSTSEGSPNWQFMENYIKILPYSDTI